LQFCHPILGWLVVGLHNFLKLLSMGLFRSDDSCWWFERLIRVDSSLFKKNITFFFYFHPLILSLLGIEFIIPFDLIYKIISFS